jgi:broad specificity phosphatase PhoE
MKFEFFFVRHGFSCANFVKEHSTFNPIQHTFYPDPELTVSGVGRSETLGPSLLNAIHKKWPQHDWTIGASVLLRAQETAFLMVAKQFKEKIYVMPYVNESPPFSFLQTLDNKPLLPNDQKNILANKYEDVLINDTDAYEVSVESKYKPSFEKFIGWAKKNLDYFGENDDGIYRAVVFTHSKFIQDLIKETNLPQGWVKGQKIRNNEAVFFSVDDNNNIKMKEYFNYGGNATNSAKLLGDMCPDGCRIHMVPACDTRNNRKGKQRKTRRRRN